MNRCPGPQAIATLAACSVLSFWLTGPTMRTGGPHLALAAEEWTVDNLAHNPKLFRGQVEQIISRVDRLIDTLKGNPGASTMVLDLIQTRDNVLRELPKVDNQPAGSKWSEKEARESVEWMLRLLKAQYDKAASPTN
jgi:hypothetical protein